jgi:putative DNA primase/helicase
MLNLNLTEDDLKQQANIIRMALAVRKPEVDRITRDYDKSETKKLTASGVSQAKAEKIVAKRRRGILDPNFVVRGENCGYITIKEIYKNPEKYMDDVFVEPLSTGVAWAKYRAILRYKSIGRNDDDTYILSKDELIIFSQYNGGTVYELEREKPERNDKYVLTELGNGERFADFIRDKLKYCSSLGTWIEYDGRRWHEISRKPLEECKSMLEQMRVFADGDSDLTKWQNKSETSRGIEAAIKLSVAYGLEEDYMKFDSNQYELNCENGLLDLHTFQLQPHCSQQKISKLARVSFSQNAKQEKWLKFIDEFTCGDVEAAKYLQKLFGLCLTGNVSEQVMHILHGAGDNGKSLLLEVMLEIMGDYATTINHNFFLSSAKDSTLEKMALRGVRVALANELPERCVLSENFIKEIIGNGVIKARTHFKDFVTFPETFKLIVSTNHKPKVFGTDNGIWRRLRLIPCELKLQAGQKDRSLKEKLLSERDGILLWCLEGLKLWHTEGLNPTERMIQEINVYRESEDTIGEFLTDCTISGDNLSINNNILYSYYVEWCKKSGENSWTKSTFTKKLCERTGEGCSSKYAIRRARINSTKNSNGPKFEKRYFGLSTFDQLSENSNYPIYQQKKDNAFQFFM